MSDAERAQHWREFFAGDYVSWPELKMKDVTLTIRSFSHEDVRMPGGKKEKRPVISFLEAEKKWIVNKTNARIIASLHGDIVQQWVGKKITLYPDPNIRFGKDKVGGIRVRRPRGA